MSIDSHWHTERSSQILRQYPETNQYFGHYPLSILPSVLVALQWLIALLVKDLPWYLVGASATCGKNRYLPNPNKYKFDELNY